MPETVDKSSLSTFFTAYSPQLRLFDFFSHRRVFACPALRFAFALLPRTSCPQLFFVSFLFLFCYISFPPAASFCLHCYGGHISRLCSAFSLPSVSSASFFLRRFFLRLFVLHFPAAMLALSLRPAILFIYLNYHSYMNTHSLARRFLP